MRRSLAMPFTAALVLLASVAGSALGAAPQQADAIDLATRYEHATLAWDRGDYVEALEGLLAVLGAPGGDAWLEEIALLTGELWTTREVAVDGGRIALAADGGLAAWHTGSGDEARVHVATLGDSFEVVLDAPGRDLVLSPDGRRAAFLAVEETDALSRARQDLAALEDAEEPDTAALQQARAAVQRAELEATRVRLVALPGGAQETLDAGNVPLSDVVFATGGDALLAVSGTPEAPTSPVVRLDLETGGTPVTVLDDGYAANLRPVPGGRFLLLERPGRNPMAPRRGRFGGGDDGGLALLDLESGDLRELAGDEATVSADGSTIAFSTSDGDRTEIRVVEPASGDEPRAVVASDLPVGDFALSPSGARLVFQEMPREDWELYVVDTTPAGDGDETGDGGDAGPAGRGDAPAADEHLATPRRLTREIQHDLAPRFLDEDTVLAAKGEGRHRRSYLYDVDDPEPVRLFHNNTVRTIAPEYEWTASADGRRILIVSERDGDTVSPERGVYLVDRAREVTAAEVVARIEASLTAERDLRARGEAMFAPIAGDVREAVAEVSMPRLYRYQEALYGFGSKHITEPGNAPAREYLAATYRSFGYEPELQWFEPTPRGRDEPVRTANVLATLRGTDHPELVYVVSSHFDSTARGPGADDNTSGTSMLLETARVLADRPLPATVIFASFTGEEAGLLGSREFVRQAQETGMRIVGALNNDMMGWSNDHRIDNTIRYSNAGIRDLQHAAAFLFSDLVTYDALYYKSTDAAAYYEAYGDIVGGIGSYPVLGNPHYHQSHDILETMNHEQIRETTRTNVASVMLLASSPSRITGLEARREADTTVVSWTPSPERGVVGYRVRYGEPGGELRELRVEEPEARLPDAAAGATVEVKAVNGRGLEGWDWARTRVDG